MLNCVWGNAQALIHHYEFDGTYSDEFGGSDMIPYGGTLTATEYIFDAGEGLSVIDVIDANNYSIELRFTPTYTSSWRKILDFNNREWDEGLYIFDGYLEFYLEEIGESVVFTEGIPVTVLLTRDGSTNEVRGYVDGVEQFVFTDEYPYATFTGPDNILYIFMDDFDYPGEDQAGSLDYVKIYDGPVTTASVSIEVSENPVCEGINAIFTATPIVSSSGTYTLTYQWTVNGIDQGTNSSTFTYTPVNEDYVTCELTIDHGFIVSAISDPINMTVNPNLPVSVIIASSSTEVCAGEPVTLTATPTNEGSTPSYQWFVNGVEQSETNPEFTYSPENLDAVTCMLTSSESCVTGNPATSESLTLTVNPLPVASITASDANDFCNGVTLTAHSSTSEYLYEWSTGETDPSIFLSIDQDVPGDYSVIVTDLNGCLSASPAVYTYAPEDLGSSYTIIGLTKCLVGPRNHVINGSVGLKAEAGVARFKVRSTVNGEGSFVKADNIFAHPKALIDSPIYDPANPSLPDMEYNTTTGTFTNLKVPSGTTATIDEEYLNLDIKQNCTVIINGSIYGNVRIGRGCSVTFTSPDIYLINLSIKNTSASSPSEILFSGDTHLKVRLNVIIDSYCTINAASYNVVFYIGEDTESVNGLFQIRDEGNVFNASIYVPHGEIRTVPTAGLTDHSFITGRFIADDFHSEGAFITWNWRDCESTLAPTMPASGPGLANGDPARLTADNRFSVYPVPNEGRFTVSINDPLEQSFTIKVYNTIGLLVYEARDVIGSGSTERTVDLGSVTPGIYLVVFQSREEHVVRKIVIN